MKIFQILHGMCHWQTPFKSLDEIVDKFPTDCLFVEAPDYVTEQWGFDETEIGDARFISPSEPSETTVMDDTTGTYVDTAVLEQNLNDAKDAKQEENNTKLAEYINSHPLLWTDGKYYGITTDDQTEIRNALEAYRSQVDLGIENPTLKWHAINEPFVDWVYEDLQRLYVAIYNEATKWVTVNSDYKTAIYACETIADVEAIVIVYEEKTTAEETTSEETTSDETADTSDSTAEATTAESATEETASDTTGTTEDASTVETSEGAE